MKFKADFINNWTLKAGFKSQVRVGLALFSGQVLTWVPSPTPEEKQVAEISADHQSRGCHPGLETWLSR